MNLIDECGAHAACAECIGPCHVMLAHTTPRPVPVTFTIPARLIGLNEYVDACRSHAKAGGRFKKAQEAHVSWSIRLAHLKPISGPVLLTFAWYERDRRRDVDNVAFAKKFILDALVRRGILAGDGRKHVVGFSDEFHVDRRNPRIIVTIERAPA